MRRVPELDALRGLAATVVLLFHLNPPRFFFGWAGVDLFFVLSGYLITSIILENSGSKGFLARFYARRTLRIWPIYYLTILGFVAINRFLPKPEPLAELPNLLTFTKNIQLYRHGSVPHAILPLDHTWTLSLEEQFYVAWPVLVLLTGRKCLIPLCVVLAVISVMARGGGTLLFWSPYSERTLLGRCDGFAMGGLLAALMVEARGEPGRARMFRIGLAMAALGALIYLVFGYVFWGGVGFIGVPMPDSPGSTTFAFVMLFFGTIGLVASFPGHPALAPLRLAPLVYLGQVSYGLYLYHKPIYWLFDGCGFRYDQPFHIAALKLGLCVAAAALSWTLIERPILALKDRFGYARKPAAIVGENRGQPSPEPR